MNELYNRIVIRRSKDHHRFVSQSMGP
ncbi:hypothetical protein NC651_008187 [Populus alba x Populus x berolinensis]|nr:hypothetical protein NC651_008187 [Populus alba x Populus x berolinensis]